MLFEHLPQELIVYDRITPFWQGKMKVILVIVTFAISLLLTGCGDSINDSGSGKKRVVNNLSVIPEKPEYGGQLVEPSLGDATNLITYIATDSASHEISSKLFIAPLQYNKDIELVPWAAESFEVLDEGKHLKFKLKEGIRWTDGVELTAEDVEFTYQLLIDPETPTAYAGDWKTIKEFRRTGRYTFEVFYEKPFSRSLVTWAMDVLPKHILEHENIANTEFSRNPVGAGPYKLKEWLPGRRVVLEANPDYFEGRPYIDTLVYRSVSDISTQFLELKAGNVDAMGLTPLQYLRQTVGPEWDNYEKYKYLSFGYSFLGFNLNHPFFLDARVRRAIDFAIDKEEIVKGVLMGMGIPAVGPYKPGTWVHNTAIRDRGYDPEQAKKLLAEAGWMDTDGDGLLDKDGKPFYFTILTNQGNSQRVKASVIIQERLREIGIKVDIRVVEWASFIHEFINKGRFDATILAFNILQDPDLYASWHSESMVPNGLNIAGYSNKELDDLIVEGRHCLDREKRKKIYDRIQEILHEDQPFCFLYVPYALPIVNAKVQGVKPAPAGISYNYTEWWIPKALQLQR